MKANSQKLKGQKGQALPVGLALVMMITLGGLVLFNTGQVVSEKSRLTNTADAAVYSGLIWQARALNFQSYTNRAMVANQVSIAQLVSLSTWSSYQKVTSTNLDTYLGWIPYVGQVIAYYKQIVDYIDQILQPVVAAVASVLDGVTGALSVSQQAMYLSTFAATPAIVKEVVERNDSRYKVDSAYSIASMAINATNWGDLVDQYDNQDQDEIVRKADLITRSRDDFTRKRYWIEPGTKLPGIYFDDWLWLGPHRYRIIKDGETRLIHVPGAGSSGWEWRGKDTVSLHQEQWKPKWNKWLRFRNHYELPVGWGERYLKDDICNSSSSSSGNTNGSGSSNNSDCDQWARSSKLQNPNAETFADDDAQEINANYSGVRAYYDLKDLSEDNKDPRLLLRVEVHATDSKIETSTKIPNLGSPAPPGGSSRRGVAETGMFYAGDKLSGNAVSAIGSGEVYFKRPVYGDYKRAVYEKGDNQLVVNNTVRKEYASLFNPYWEVRLIELPKEQRMAAWLINSPDLASAASSGVVAGVQAYADQQSAELTRLTRLQQRLQTDLANAANQAAAQAIRQRLSNVQQSLTQLNAAIANRNNLASRVTQTGIGVAIQNATGLAQRLPNYGGAGATVVAALNNGVTGVGSQMIDQAKDAIAKQAKNVLKQALAGAAKSALQQYGGNTYTTAQNLYTNAQKTYNNINTRTLVPLQNKLNTITQQVNTVRQNLQTQFDSQKQALQTQIQQKQNALATATDPVIAAQLNGQINSLNNQLNQLDQQFQTKLDQATAPLLNKIDKIQKRINKLKKSTQNKLNAVGTVLGG